MTYAQPARAPSCLLLARRVCYFAQLEHQPYHMDSLLTLARPSRPAAREAVAGAVRNLLEDDGASGEDGPVSHRWSSGDRGRLAAVALHGSKSSIARSTSHPALIGLPEPSAHKDGKRAGSRQRPTNNALLCVLPFLRVSGRLLQSACC